MTIYFVGGEVETYTPSDLTNIASTTTATYFNSTYSRQGLRVHTSTAAYLQFRLRDLDTGVLASPTALWLHFNLTFGGVGSSNTRIVSLYNSAGTEVFRLSCGTNTTAFRPYYRSSAGTLTVLGSGDSAVIGTSNNSVVDLFVDCAGTISLYIDGSLQASCSGSFSSTQTDNIQTIRLSTCVSSNGCGYSQVVAASESTIGWRVSTRPATGDGAHTAATGTYADIDDTTATATDTDFAAFAAVGDKETYTGSAATAPDGYDIKAVVVGARAKIGASGPGNFKGLLRVSGADYASAYNIPTYNNTSFDGGLAGFTLNPATGLPWTLADANGAEFGLEATA